MLHCTVTIICFSKLLISDLSTDNSIFPRAKLVLFYYELFYFACFDIYIERISFVSVAKLLPLKGIIAFMLSSEYII